MSKSSFGLSLPEIQFTDGALDPPRRDTINDPQNLWLSIDNNSRWCLEHVLTPDDALSVYLESDSDVAVATHTPGMADEKRAISPTYTDERNLASLAIFLMLPGGSQIVDDFTKKTVLEIGSGKGMLADDLRRKSKAQVLELDFSTEALSKSLSIFKGRGSKIVGDGLHIPLADASVDRTISLYSTSVHTDSIHDRLLGLTEALRVTAEGGRVVIVPLFGGMMHRQQQWMHIPKAVSSGTITEQEADDHRILLRREAAMDYATTRLLQALTNDGYITLAPVLAIDSVSTGKDIVSAVMTVQQPLSGAEAEVYRTRAKQAYENDVSLVRNYKLQQSGGLSL